MVDWAVYTPGLHYHGGTSIILRLTHSLSDSCLLTGRMRQRIGLPLVVIWRVGGWAGRMADWQADGWRAGGRGAG